MKILDLSLSDVDDIIKLQDQSSYFDGWNKKMIVDALSGGRFYLLGAFEENKLIGIIGINDNVDFFDITEVLVLTEFRKQGVAKQLLFKIEDKIKNLKQDKVQVFLEVRENNIPAKNLYLSSGYKIISKRNKYYFDGENAVIMKKEI